MSSRYPTIKVTDYCFHPVHVVDDTKDIYVPCGKCDGCLLHKANEWSQRVGMEMETTRYNIFFSLTYSNEYIPKLIKSDFYSDSLSPFWYSDNIYNWRYDGNKKVRRFDRIIFDDYNFPFIPLKNSDFKCIPYLSKRDLQLWLKSVRTDICKTYGKSKSKSNNFRYFIIGEIGPTTFRPHYHGIIFCESKEISSYLLSCSLFENWKMCDKSRFEPYAHFADSGARGYVTQYLTSNSDIPKVYNEIKSIKPFRLSSKAPGIGYSQFDKAKVYEDVANGIIQYSRIIRRLGQSCLLSYPAGFASTLFPKCYQYSKLSHERILALYGCLWREVNIHGGQYSDVCKRLSSSIRNQDFQSMRSCFYTCSLLNICPDTYTWLLDRYYYLKSMVALEFFYSNSINVKSDFHDYVLQYVNFSDVVYKAAHHIGRWSLVLDFFLSSCGIENYDINDFLNKDFYISSPIRNDYILEVQGIVRNMTKTSKLNEFIGNSPSNF
jgi:hypothetical protein